MCEFAAKFGAKRELVMLARNIEADQLQYFLVANTACLFELIAEVVVGALSAIAIEIDSNMQK